MRKQNLKTIVMVMLRVVICEAVRRSVLNPQPFSFPHRHLCTLTHPCSRKDGAQGQQVLSLSSGNC